MDTTVSDFARFAAAFVRGDRLSRKAHEAMLRPQLPITTRSQFPTLQAELPPGERRRDLAAGLGVIVFEGPQGPGFFKGGPMDRKGVIGVAVLWLAAGLCALSLAAMAVARHRVEAGRAQLQEWRAIHMARGAALFEQGLNFARADATHHFDTGTVRTQCAKLSPTRLTLLCVVESGSYTKEIETGWERAADGWRAVYWREIT